MSKSPFDRRSSLRSALLVAGSTYVSFATGLICSMLIARSLGPREFGQYAYLVWLAGLLTMVMCNGLTLIAIRFISEALGRGNPGEAAAIHRLLQRWFLISVVATALIFALASAWLTPSGWTRPVWLFAGFALIAAVAKAGYTLGISISKGLGRFEVDARVISILSAVNLVAVILLAAVGAPLLAFMLLFVGLGIGHLVATRFLMPRVEHHAGNEPLPHALRSRIFTEFGWTALLLMSYAFTNKSIETQFLNTQVGPEAVGWFVVGASLTRGGIELLSSGLSTVLMPAMSHAFGSNERARGLRIFQDALRYYFFLGLVLAGAGALWSDLIVGVMYGSPFAPAAVALQVMIVVGALTMSEAAIGSLLTTTGRQSMRVALAIFAIVITLVASFFFIPAYGFTGALLAHAVSRAILFAVSMGAIVQLLGLKLPWSDIWRMLAAAAIAAMMAAGVLLISTGAVAHAVAGCVYAFVCVVASVCVRAWTSADVKLAAMEATWVPALRRPAAWFERNARDR